MAAGTRAWVSWATWREFATGQLGNVATMLGRTIEYDPVAGACPGDDQASAALDREHREGWKL